MQQIMVVGVDNTEARMDEYTYSVDPEYGGGKGDLYLDFLSETVGNISACLSLAFAVRYSSR